MLIITALAAHFAEVFGVPHEHKGLSPAAVVDQYPLRATEARFQAPARTYRVAPSLPQILKSHHQTADDAEASTAQYEALCDQWARFSPAIVHRMLRQRLLDDGKTEQEFTCEVR